MREMGIVSYLESYLRDVSGTSSLSIHKLVKLMKKNYRIRDPLILYCAFTEKEKILDKYTNGEFHDVVTRITIFNFLDDIFKDYEFRKINDSFWNKIRAKTYENKTKNMIRENILKIMQKKNISKYRIYTDLKLNPGNVNDFLTNGNCKKVSLDVAKRIYSYVDGYEPLNKSHMISYAN